VWLLILVLTVFLYSIGCIIAIAIDDGLPLA
jgi:hypothetical protein